MIDPHLAVLAFGEPIGQGWQQIGYLAIAFALSLVIGLEREAQQKSAGMRTYTLVGLGAALFVLVSKYGFTDVLVTGRVVLDPSRVAAQIVTGVGFIGGGLIFVRRDAVRGLTTAASVWLTAAVGAAAGAGLPLLAGVATAFYFAVLYGLRRLARAVPRLSPDLVGLRITYLDGRGVLRDVLNKSTRHGFAIAELTTAPASPAPTIDSRDPPTRATVEVALALTGRGDLGHLISTLSELAGVLAVETGAPHPEE